MDIKKLKACLVYACHKAAQQLDSVKLNKVLWYTDSVSFIETGASVTGARYIRKPRGPVASVMRVALEELVSDGDLTSGHRFDPDRGVWLLEYLPASDDAASESLSKAEKAYLDHSIKRACFDHTSDQISDRTHGEIWELAANGEEMPLYTMFAERLAKVTKENVNAASAV